MTTTQVKPIFSKSTSSSNELLESMVNRIALYMKLLKKYVPEDMQSHELLSYALQKSTEEGNVAASFIISQLREVPVTIEEFVKGKHYLNEADTVWDNVMEDIKDLNPYLFDSNSVPVSEVILGGAIGTAKSYIATKGLQYLVYVLNCFKQPQKLFNLDPNTRIVIVLLSTSEGVAKKTLFEPLRDGYIAMDYYKRKDTPKRDKDVKNSLFFPDTKIEVSPMTALPTSYIGQAVIGGIMDEVNFLQFVEQSKQISNNRGQGGVYDQAQVNYSALTKRKQSRFLNRHISLGTLYLCSSVHYEGDFLERRVKKAQETNNPNIKILRRKQFEVIPEGRFSGKIFRFLIGTNEYPSRVLEDKEIEGKDFAQGAWVEKVPIEYKQGFIDDPEGSQRDVLAIPTSAISRFISRVDKVFDAFNRGKKSKLKHWVVKENVELARDGFLQINPKNLPGKKDRKAPRFVHVDASSTKDRTAIAIVKVAGWVRRYDEDNDIEEYLPRIAVEFACSIKPSPQHEIQMSEIRKFLITLKNSYKINIKKVSYDQYQSRESLQLLRRRGFVTERISVDKPIDAYLQLKDMIYEDRIDIVSNEILSFEVTNLEKNEVKNKVDHPVKGSKDIADAVCGACWSLMKNRKVLFETMQKNQLISEGTSITYDDVFGQESYRKDIVTSDGPMSNKDII
jgi:hypothetical protein